MLLNLLVLFVAILLSAVAAYYSIVGLAAIFSGAFLSIVLMGAALELGKLVTASWLYRNWSIAPRMLKVYLSIAVVILMFITSMGIFGYLSKAHLESSANATTDLTAEIQTINDSIQSKENTKQLIERQINNIDNTLSKYLEAGDITKGLQQKRRLDGERKQLESERKANDKELIELKTKRNQLTSEQKKVEVEVGPLKYIAELVYGEEAKDHFDSAVRMVILLLIAVFDPLAVILLIAANFGLQHHKRNKHLMGEDEDSIIIDKSSIMELK
jgi:hypothetical protein